MAELDYRELGKYIKMTGERAKIDAKIYNTYIVYKDSKGNLVREYPDGKIILDQDDDI